jgi:hypothetical protein
MHPYLSDVMSTAHPSDLRAEAPLWIEPSRRGAYVTAPRLRERWDSAARRFAAWAQRPRAGRSAELCCPA